VIWGLDNLVPGGFSNESGESLLTYTGRGRQHVAGGSPHKAEGRGLKDKKPCYGICLFPSTFYRKTARRGRRSFSFIRGCFVPAGVSRPR